MVSIKDESDYVFILHTYQESTIEVLKMSLYVANELRYLIVELDLLALVAIRFVYL